MLCGADLPVGSMAGADHACVGVGEASIRYDAVAQPGKRRLFFGLEAHDTVLKVLAAALGRNDAIPQKGRGDRIHRLRRDDRIKRRIGHFDDVRLPDASDADPIHEGSERLGRLTLRGLRTFREHTLHESLSPPPASRSGIRLSRRDPAYRKRSAGDAPIE